MGVDHHSARGEQAEQDGKPAQPLKLADNDRPRARCAMRSKITAASTKIITGRSIRRRSSNADARRRALDRRWPQPGEPSDRIGFGGIALAPAGNGFCLVRIAACAEHMELGRGMARELVIDDRRAADQRRHHIGDQQYRAFAAQCWTAPTMPAHRSRRYERIPNGCSIDFSGQ